MEVSVTDGGTMELFNGGSQFKELSFLNYLVMSNELSTPKVLHCPADSDHMAATNFGVNFNNSSISYFLGLAASPKNSQAFLSGDDNFAIGDRPVKPSVLPLATNAPVTWTATRHINRGSIGLADGSVWQTDDEELVQKLVAIGVATNRLAIP